MKAIDAAYPNIDALVHDREVLTVEQAAEYLQIHKATIYKYIRAGLLPAARLGKVYRIYRKDLEALIVSARASGK